jgi:hypothetical protein
MEKKNLTQVIDKYHLNGLIESVTWNSTEDDGISVKFVTPTKDCAGSVSTTKDLGLGANDISIYSTSQFNKLLGIMDIAMVNIDVITGNQGIPYQLKVKDNDFDLDFYLSSEDLIPSVPNISEPDEYDVNFSIDEDFIKNFTKAYSALDKPNRFEIGCKNIDNIKHIELTVGDSATFANKIKMVQPSEYTIGIEPMSFSANIVKEILAVNKTAEGKAKINEAGLLKLEFTEDDITSIYFVVKLAE